MQYLFVELFLRAKGQQATMAFARLPSVRDKSYFSSNRDALLTAAFLLAVPVVAHLLFSWRGFTPTDDGFTLAYSRRILDGEVPHRDFIIIRPFLSPLIHTPFVLFSGEYTYWLSRLFVWFQFACIAWAWVSVVDRAFDNAFSDATKLFVGVLVFAASAHHFVLTAWHTVDGLFLASIGLWMVTRQEATGKGFGYALIAAAYLCKQSFLFMAPLSLLFLGDWRRSRCWIAAALPGLAYCAYLLATGSFPDAFIQLTSQTGIVSTGATSYLNYATLLGVVAGLSAMLLSSGAAAPPLPARPSRYAGASMLAAIPAIFTAVGLFRGGLAVVSFGVFGMVLGALLYCATSRATQDAGRIRAAALVLLFAWSASLSIGYNAPGLMLGPMLAVLWALAYSTVRETPEGPGLGPRVLQAAVVVLGAAILVGFWDTRANHIYREQPSSELTKPLGGVLPGGALIYTNPRTYAYMADLKDATVRAREKGKRYAIIPQTAGWWVQSEQPNPLPIDWPWPVELGNRQLNDRVTRALAAERGKTVVIVQRVEAFDLAGGEARLDSKRYPVVQYVRANYRKTGETRFFELYE